MESSLSSDRCAHRCDKTRIYSSLLDRKQQQDALDQQQNEEERSLPCQLQWRQGQLLVKLSQNVKQPIYLPSIENQQWLVRCLEHSPVAMVCIDTNLGAAAVKHWANACQQAKKPIFLRGSVTRKGNLKTSKLCWYIKLIDWFITLLLLMVLSPIILPLIVLQMYVYSPRAIFSKEWCVGARGKLFQSLRFRMTEVEHDSRTTPLGYWIRKCNIHKLPQLFNILRGEMSLLGQPPVNLCDAVGSTPGELRHLKALPNNGLVAGLVA